MAEEQIDFSNIEDTETTGLNADDFSGGKFLKNPAVGETISFVVKRVEENKNTTGKSKTGQEFRVGLRYKTGEYKRYDIYTEEGIYTINNWEIFFKLFGGGTGLLLKYAQTHNKSFAGAKVSIKRLLEGGHMGTKISDLAKILGTSVEEATKYQEKIKLAIKEQRLYDVQVTE
jgi:hypothetical protein